MVIDKKLNLKHANSPKVGDYWQEMLQPILLVLSVNNKTKMMTYVEELVLLKPNYYTWNLEKTITIPISEFKNKVCYSTNSDNTWCDVVPKSSRHTDYIKEYRNLIKRKRHSESKNELT